MPSGPLLQPAKASLRPVQLNPSRLAASAPSPQCSRRTSRPRRPSRTPPEGPCRPSLSKHPPRLQSRRQSSHQFPIPFSSRPDQLSTRRQSTRPQSTRLLRKLTLLGSLRPTSRTRSQLHLLLSSKLQDPWLPSQPLRPKRRRLTRTNPLPCPPLCSSSAPLFQPQFPELELHQSRKPIPGMMKRNHRIRLISRCLESSLHRLSPKLLLLRDLLPLQDRLLRRGPLLQRQSFPNCLQRPSSHQRLTITRRRKRKRHWLSPFLQLPLLPRR